MSRDYQTAMWTPREPGVRWARGTLTDADLLLSQDHYLGPSSRNGVRYVFMGWLDGQPVATQVWRLPTSRKLPNDGSWLELSRWCLTPEAGPNAGSRMNGWVVRWFRRHTWITTLISYSDPAVGHTGTVYRASGWTWKPTWHRFRPPPTGGGSWDGIHQESVKDRWAYFLHPDTAQERLEPAYEWARELAASASSDASGFQPEEGGSHPTTPLHSESVA